MYSCCVLVVAHRKSRGEKKVCRSNLISKRTRVHPPFPGGRTGTSYDAIEGETRAAKDSLIVSENAATLEPREPASACSSRFQVTAVTLPLPADARAPFQGQSTLSSSSADLLWIYWALVVLWSSICLFHASTENT